MSGPPQDVLLIMRHYYQLGFTAADALKRIWLTEGKTFMSQAMIYKYFKKFKESGVQVFTNVEQAVGKIASRSAKKSQITSDEVSETQSELHTKTNGIKRDVTKASKSLDSVLSAIATKAESDIKKKAKPKFVRAKKQKNSPSIASILPGLVPSNATFPYIVPPPIADIGVKNLNIIESELMQNQLIDSSRVKAELIDDGEYEQGCDSAPNTAELIDMLVTRQFPA